jgi:hypothetical protein
VDYTARVDHLFGLLEQFAPKVSAPKPVFEVVPHDPMGACLVFKPKRSFIRVAAFDLEPHGYAFKDWDWVIAHELGHWEDYVVNFKEDYFKALEFFEKVMWDWQCGIYSHYYDMPHERYANNVALRLTGKTWKEVNPCV